MFKNIVRIVLSIIAFVAGYELFKFAVPSVIAATNFPLQLPAGWFNFLGGGITGLIFYFIIPHIISYLNKFSSWAEGKMRLVPTQDIVLGVIGLIIALIIGVLLSFPLSRIPLVGPYLALVITLVLAYLGVNLFLSRKDDFPFITSSIVRRSPFFTDSSNNNYGGKKGVPPKVLDTSVIIDGRIMDICKTGFLEGEIIVPGFVLEELRHIADSPDLLKRNRGRRGLDILNKMQKELSIEVNIVNMDYEDIEEVDSKLVKLAQDFNGVILTNDFNLSKVCQLQGVTVLNINELANAVKPVLLPGEEMKVHVIKDGKEAGQGIAYLDDGTMIVVEGGKKHIGESIDILVTSVLQTAAGRMIFAKPSSNLSEKVSAKQ